jgi:hypothetical protein
VLPHGYVRSSFPPDPAYSHSADVGSRPPSHTQNANASNQFTQFMGSRSVVPSVRQVCSASHCTAVASAAELAAMEAFQAVFQPLPAMSGWAPAPIDGGPAYADTNLRNLPTVTSYLSSA